ncbi:uridine kinase [bacterium]|nr:uridine kinase [bacterium]
MTIGWSALRLHSLSRKVLEATGHREKAFVPPLILGVCGGSGSGKTTFCDKLVELVGGNQVALLKQDDYYRDQGHLPLEERSETNFDHPDSIEFPLLCTHIDLLDAGHQIAVPQYDFKTHTRTRIQRIVSPRPIVILEGILIFSDVSLESRIHHKIFIDATEEVRFHRRLRRDVKERGRSPESVSQQFEETVRPMHEQFVEPCKERSDRVISGEIPFETVLLELSAYLRQTIRRS